MSELDEVISKIRHGELILWVGSGFSKNAGYPTGSELSSVIKNKVSREEQKYFENKFSLDEVAEEFVQIYSREDLISILQEVFKKKPTNLMLHEMVSQIPQIQTIITTNYDKSFELAYGTDIFTIIKDNDIPDIPRNKVNLYKIHGDIDSPATILITKSDYSDYYTKGKDSLLWNEIKSLISKYSILFIGYSFEDSNVKSIFKDILDRLENHKDYYLITPDLYDYKGTHLLDKYSIRYIDMYAEEAIVNIRKKIVENLIIDTEDGCIPPHLTYKIYNERNIHPDLSIGEDGKPNFESITSLAGGPEIEGKFFLTAPIDKASKLNEFNSIISGSRFGKCVISQDDCTIKASVTVGESLLFDPKDNNLSSLTYISNPSRLFSVNFLLRKSEMYFCDLNGELYSSRSNVQIRVFHHGFDFTITKSLDIKKPETNIHLKIHVKNIIQGYDIYKFLNTWVEGDTLQIDFNRCDLPTIRFSKFNIAEKEVRKIKLSYDFCSKLLRIQREFDLNFGDFTLLADDDLYVVNELISLLDGNKVHVESISSFMTILNENIFLMDLDKEVFVPSSGLISRHYLLMGTEIVLNCNFYLYDGFIANKQEIISKVKEGCREVNITMESKSNNLFLVYEKDST